MDPSNLPQSTPVVPPIDPNIGNIQEMELGDIVGAYDKMGQGIDQMGQNILADVAGRQQQLIGNNFGTPAEGPMGDYNENTYISPVVSSARSQVAQIGTQVALKEGMRRSEEAAEQQLKDAQKRYDEYIAEQNRKAAEQAATNAANRDAAVNAIDPEYLKEKGMTQDDFQALTEAEKGNHIKQAHDRARNIEWDDRDQWYKAVNAVYKKFGITGKAAMDERTGNQSEENKALWKRKDVGDYFTEQYLNKYGDGAQILKERNHALQTTRAAIDRWMNPKTEEDRMLGFDEVFRAVAFTMPTKTAIEEGSAEDLLSQVKSYQEDERRSRALSSEEQAEVKRISQELRRGKMSGASRLQELLSKAAPGGSGGGGGWGGPNEYQRSKPNWSPEPKKPAVRYEYGEQEVTIADVMEGVFGLDAKELVALRDFKQNKPEEFSHVMDITAKVHAGTFISRSDGTDVPDNYYRDPSTGKMTLAENGQIIIHSIAGGNEDPQLKQLRDMLDDEVFWDSATRAYADDPNATDEDRKRAEQFDKVAEKYRQNQIAALYLGDIYEVNAGSSLYNAAMYTPGDDESGKLKIKGKKISDIVWEWRDMARDDQEGASVKFRDLVASANRSVGHYTDKDGYKVPLVDEHGDSTISARGGHFEDYTVEEAAAVLSVLQKELNSGGIDTNFLGTGPGTSYGAGGKIAEVASTTGDVIKMVSGFVAGGYFDDEQKTIRGKLYYGGAQGIIMPQKGEWGYQTRKDEENYDRFRTLMDVQYSADGKEGYFAQSTDMGVGAKRFGGEVVAFGADIAFGLLGPATGKLLAVRAAKQISTKLVTSAGKKLAGQIAENVGQRMAMSVPQDVAMFEIKSAAGTVTKKTLNEISTDIAKLSLDGKSAASYLKQIDPVAFKGVGPKTMDKMLEDAWGGSVAKKLGISSAARKTMAFIERDAAGITALTTSGIPMRSIEQASEPALRAAVRLIGEVGDEIIGTVARRKAKEAGASTAGKAAGERFGALTGRQMAKELVEAAAKRGASGNSMNKYDVLKFMATRGDDSARKRVFAGRFLEGELVGNALFMPSMMRNTMDPATGESMLQDPSYLLSEFAIGSALSLGGMGLARGFRGAQLANTKRRLTNVQDVLSRNAQNINSPEYRKAVAELDKLATRAERLSDDAMEYAFSPDKVADFRKTAAIAKEAIIKQLDHIQNQFQPETFGKSVETKELIGSLTAKQGFGRRYILSVSALRSEATLDYRRLANDLPILSSFDDETSARITADAYDAVKKLPEGSTFEEQREAFIEGIANAMPGVGYKEARREAEYLMDEYSKTWDMVVKAADDGIIDIETYGGRSRSAYLSPAGITHTINSDIATVNWGIIAERKVNADIAKPVFKRTADHGVVARAWADGKKATRSGHIKVRNPEGFNLVKSLHTYNNMMRSEIYLNSIDRGIVKNGDAIILGRHNVEAAVKADQVYWSKQLDSARAELKELKKSLPSGSKAADAIEDTPEITALQERISELETSLRAYQGVNLPSSVVGTAARIAGVSEDEFIKEYTATAALFKASKESILGGGAADEQIARYAQTNGDYNRDSVLEAVFNKYDRAPVPAQGEGTPKKAADSQYMKGVTEAQQKLIRERSVDNEYTRSVLNEGRRRFSETDGSDGVYGIGDLVEWVAQRLPLSKSAADNKDSLKWNGLSGLFTKQGIDQQLAKAFKAGDEDVKLFIEAINSNRSDSSVLLREYDTVADRTPENIADEGSVSDLEGAPGFAQSGLSTGSNDPMALFDSLPTERKQAAISFVEDMLRPSLYGKAAPAIEKIPFKGTGRLIYPKEVLDRQHNLAEIVAKNNILDPDFDESPMFDRFIVPEGGKAGSIRVAQGETPLSIYYGDKNSPGRELSNLAERRFTYDGREYGSVEHAYQTLKNGKFDKAIFDKYEAAGGFGKKFRSKLEVDADNPRRNLELMEDLVVQSIRQNPDSEAAMLLRSNSDFSHPTNTEIDQAFLRGLRRAKEELGGSPKDSSSSVMHSRELTPRATKSSRLSSIRKGLSLLTSTGRATARAERMVGETMTREELEAAMAGLGFEKAPQESRPSIYDRRRDARLHRSVLDNESSRKGDIIAGSRGWALVENPTRDTSRIDYVKHSPEESAWLVDKYEDVITALRGAENSAPKYKTNEEWRAAYKEAMSEVDDIADDAPTSWHTALEEGFDIAFSDEYASALAVAKVGPSPSGVFTIESMVDRLNRTYNDLGFTPKADTDGAVAALSSDGLRDLNPSDRRFYESLKGKNLDDEFDRLISEVEENDTKIESLLDEMGSLDKDTDADAIERLATEVRLTSIGTDKTFVQMDLVERYARDNQPTWTPQGDITPDGSAVQYYRSTRLPDGSTVKWEEMQQALRNHRRMFGEYYADPIFLNRTRMDGDRPSFYTLGSYSYEEDLIRLATDNADLIGTGYHEAVHRVIGQFLEDAEIHQLYKDMLVSVGGKRRLNEMYGDQYTGGWRQQAEEHIANAFREYKANRLPDYKRRGAQKRVAEMAEKLGLPESVIRIFDALFDRMQGFVYGSTKGRAASRDNIIDLFKRIDSGEFADAIPKGRTKAMSYELQPAALKALNKLKSEMRYKGAMAAIDMKYKGRLAATDMKSKASLIAEAVVWIGRQLGDDVAAMKKAIEASSLARYEKSEAKALLDHTEKVNEIQRRFDEEMASRAEADSRTPLDDQLPQRRKPGYDAGLRKAKEDPEKYFKKYNKNKLSSSIAGVGGMFASAPLSEWPAYKVEALYRALEGPRTTDLKPRRVYPNTKRLTEDLVDETGKPLQRGVLMPGTTAKTSARALSWPERMQDAAEQFDWEWFDPIFWDESSRIRELIERPNASELLQSSGLPAPDYAAIDEGGLGDLDHLVDIVTDDYQRQFDELLDQGDITPAEYTEWGTGIREKITESFRDISEGSRKDKFNEGLGSNPRADVEYNPPTLREGAPRLNQAPQVRGGYRVMLPEQGSVPMRQSSLARFYAEAGDFSEAEAGIRNNIKSTKAAVTRARKKQSAIAAAEVEALEGGASETKARIRAAQKRAKEARQRLEDINAYKAGDAYINRNGLKFLDDANGLTGYTKLGVLLESQRAEKMLPGIKNKLENSRRRKRNKKANAVNQQSINAREANYNDIIGLVQAGASGNADNAQIKVTQAMVEDAEFKKAFPEAEVGDMMRRDDSVADDGLLINQEDILVHEGLAAIKSIEQKQFSSKQGLQMALLKISGFNKAVQNIQLSAGYSMYNAYSFRFLLSAMMQNPTQALPMLKTFSDARNMKQVASFWGKNQELFNRVTMITGDSMYVDAFSDANSLLTEQSTGYLGRMVRVHKQTAYREVMERYSPEEQAKIAERAGYDSAGNAPDFDASTAMAERRGTLNHIGHDITKAVELTWDAPTFQRFIPVLQGTMFMKNYDLALKRKLRDISREVKSGVRDTPEMTQTDIDGVLMLAHLRTKLFFSPTSASRSLKEFVGGNMKGSTFDNEAIRNFIQNLNDDQIKEIVRGDQGNNMNKIITSLFFALEYKATQIGQMLNGLRGVGRQDSFVLQGSKNQVSIMTALIAAAFVFNEMNGRDTAFDSTEKVLLNLNNLGKFRLGDGDNTPSIDPFFSQFTLLNAATRMAYGVAGIEGGTATNNTNPHRGYGPFRWSHDRVNAVQDELVSTLLSPYKTLAEIATNNTYFGNNIWEHPTMKDGTPNPNYNLLRNIGASMMHAMNLHDTNAWVKGENTTQDRIGRTSGSGILQHPYLDMRHAYMRGDYAEALFTALELPVKWDNLDSSARTSLNGYVIKSIAGYKRDYDKKVEEAKGDKSKVDEAYKVFAEQSIKTINDWNARNGNPLESNPKLVSAAQKILTGFLSDEYDDNLNRMQSAFWRARIESQMGDDFEFDMRDGESEEEFAERKEQVNKFWFGQLDKEFEARQMLEKTGYDVQGFDYNDMMTEYRNMHRNVIAQFEKAIKGKVSGFDNLAEQKKNFEMRIGNVDEIYTDTKKARAKKTELANQHNKAVLDLLTPYVEQYGPYTLDFYDRSDKRGLADMAAELIIIPAEELWKYGTNKTPEKNYLKDQFGVGWKNNSNLPSDAEFKRKFDKVSSSLQKGSTATASTLLDRIIKEVQRGQYGVSGPDWSRVVRYREIINGRLGL